MAKRKTVNRSADTAERTGVPAAGGVVQRALSLSLGTLDAEARTVESVLVSETPIRYRFGRTEWDEMLLMDGMQAVDQVPLLDSHDRYRVENIFGSVRGIRVDGKRAIGTLHFAGSEGAQNAFELAQSGHLTDVSGGMWIEEVVRVLKGETVDVRGRAFKAPDRDLYLYTKWRLREVSLVAIGADETAKLRGEANREIGPGNDDGQTPGGGQENNRGDERMNERLKKFLVSRGLRSDADDATAQAFFEGLGGATRALADRLHAGEEVPESELTGTQERGAAAGTAPEAPAPGAPAAEAGAVDRALAAERERIRSIRALGREHEMPAEVVERCESEGFDIARTQQVFLENIRTRRASQAVHGGVHTPPQQREATERQMQDAMIVRCGMDLDCRDENERDQRMGAAERFRHMRVIDLAVRSLELAGVSVPHGPNEILARAIGTHAFGAIFANIQNKKLVASIEEAPSTARQWCGRMSMNDFKTHRDVRVSNAEVMEEITNAGTIPYGEFKDTYQDASLKTFGQRNSFTRQQMINDDLGALLDTPAKVARAAMRLVDDLVYALLLANAAGTINEDGKALFATDHTVRKGTKNVTFPNLFSGATTVLGVEGLRKGKQVMRQIKGMVGESLNLRPSFLVVPPELEFTAQQLLTSSILIAGGAADNSVQGNANVHSRNPMEVVVEDRLSDSGFHANASTTAWYLGTKQEKSIVLGFLNGQETPQLMRTNLDDPLAMHWVAIFDVVAAIMGYRGMVKSTGAN